MQVRHIHIATLSLSTANMREGQGGHQQHHAARKRAGMLEMLDLRRRRRAAADVLFAFRRDQEAQPGRQSEPIARAA